MAHISFQCPENGWIAIVDYDEDEGVLDAWAGTPSDEEVSVVGQEKMDRIVAEVEEWCRPLKGRRVRDGLEADRILRRMGVYDADLFGFVECRRCGSDEGEYDTKLCRDCRYHLDDEREAKRVLDVLAWS